MSSITRYNGPNFACSSPCSRLQREEVLPQSALECFLKIEQLLKRNPTNAQINAAEKIYEHGQDKGYFFPGGYSCKDQQTPEDLGRFCQNMIDYARRAGSPSPNPGSYEGFKPIF